LTVNLLYSRDVLYILLQHSMEAINLLSNELYFEYRRNCPVIKSLARIDTLKAS